MACEPSIPVLPDAMSCVECELCVCERLPAAGGVRVLVHTDKSDKVMRCKVRVQSVVRNGGGYMHMRSGKSTIKTKLKMKLKIIL